MRLRELLEGHGRRSPECRPVTATVPVSEALGVHDPTEGRCLRCGVRLDETEVLRVQLHDLGGARRAAEGIRRDLMDQTVPLVLAAAERGLKPTELTRLTQLSRRTIYNIITAKGTRS